MQMEIQSSSNNQFKKSEQLDQIKTLPSDQLQQNQRCIPQPNYNGFTKGFTLIQALPLIYGIVEFAQTIILIIYLSGQSLKISLYIIYCAITFILIILWFLATKIDPTDQTQIQHRRALQNKMEFNLQNCKYFCNLCQTYVGKESFHCKKCNRCVQVFDHHCKWLNNCIGAKNYLQFFGLVCAAEISLIFNLVLNCVGIGLTISKQQQLNWQFYMKIVFVCMDTVIICFNSILFCMHFYLIISKKTTLQLILQRRKINKIHPSIQITKLQKKSIDQKYSNLQSNISQSVADKRQIIHRPVIDSKTQNFTVKKIYNNKQRCKTLVIKTNNIKN